MRCDHTGIEAPSIAAVEVIGGGSRSPCVKETLESCFGHDLSFTMDGSLAICQGVALAVRSVHCVSVYC